MPRITRIRGMVPREAGCTLPPEFASTAKNLDLSSGRYEPWFVPLEIVEFPFEVKSSHIRECCWGGVQNCHAVYTDAGIPKKTYLSIPDCQPLVTDSFCDQQWCFAGIPVPERPLSIIDPTVPVCEGPDGELVRYRITYAKGCDEGPASLASEPIKWQKGALVAIGLPPPPEVDWCVDTVNIYRQQSLWDATQALTSFEDNEIASGWTSTDTDTDWFKVATLSIEDRSWLDDGAEPGSLLVTEDYFPPSEGLEIVGETSEGSLVGFESCNLWLSERNVHYGWPLKSRHSFESDIRQVCVVRNDIYVFTCEQVYRVEDTADCRDANCRPFLNLEATEPVVSDRLGVVMTEQGCLYVGATGLHQVTQSGVQRVSQAAFSKHDWKTLDPHTMQIIVACGHVFLSTRAKSYVWALQFDETGRLPADVVELDIVPEHWLTDDKDNLYFLSGNCAYQFNAGNERMQGHWRQSPQRSEDRQVVSSVYAQYNNKKSGNKIAFYNQNKPVESKLLREGVTRIRGQASTCYQLQITGPSVLCELAYGSALNRFGGEQ